MYFNADCDIAEKESNDAKIDLAQKVIKETLWAIFLYGDTYS